MIKSTRGWEISEGTKTIKSLDLEKTGIVCTDEPNIDNKSFNNEFIYNEDSQSYSLNTSRPNQVQFTLKFEITKFGIKASNAIEDLKSYFDKPGLEFTIIRNVNKFPNTFVIDSIDTSHYTSKGEWAGFEVSGSYVGEYRDYAQIREKVIFTGEIPMFEFPHSFSDPEPSTMFDEQIPGDFIKTLTNDTGRLEGLIYHIEILEPIDSIKITNQTMGDVFKIDYPFSLEDEVTFNTELDEPEIMINSDGELINLLTFIDFSVSVLPMLYSGDNEIRIDLYYEGQGKEGAKIWAEYWNRGVSI